MQPELFERPGFTVNPEPGRNGPKLWVRRLVIWREPKQIIRDVPLRPGLNIIWSPDSLEEDSPIGHGGGKTTFCRLLRFCLGEETFAPPVLRQRIAGAFPKGHVGAEIMLDGHLWIVVRSLGRKRDFVQEGGQLEDAFLGGSKPTGIEPLIDALTQGILGAAKDLMPRSIGPNGSWLALLAWMTRDQECRFGHALEWRSSDTDSHSPVVNRSTEDRLLIVRAAIGALSAEEMAALAEEEKLKTSLNELKSCQGRQEWEIDSARQSIEATVNASGADSISEAPIALEIWRKIADERMAAALNIPGRTRPGDVQAMRRSRDAAKEELDRLKANASKLDSQISAKDLIITTIRSELPEAYAELNREGNQICPICKVLIDEAVAKGCGISKEKCDLRALQEGIQQRRRLIDDTGREIAALRDERKSLQQALASTETKFAVANRDLDAIERAYDASLKSIRAAQRLQEDVEHFEALIGTQKGTRSKVQNAETDLEKIREKLSGYRQASSERIRRLSHKFDMVLRDLVPGVCGSTKIDGNGLRLNVEWGGDRSTAALDSLKVVVFDLAVLAMSMEETLPLPGLLVHDSPREADLSATVYSRLFAVALRMEGGATEPYFQYILTTTTSPPEEFREGQWLRLSVKGAPGEERLLGVDL
jgi:hypothetical protein